MTDQKPLVIRQLHRVLLALKLALISDPDFELGDSPVFVEEFLGLVELNHAYMARYLAEAYNLHQKGGLQAANLYFKLNDDFGKVKKQIDHIQRQGCGSLVHTKNVLDLVDRCLDDLIDLANDAGVPLIPHEMSLILLEQRIPADHPNGDQLKQLLAKLNRAWARGDDVIFIEAIFSELDELALKAHASPGRNKQINLNHEEEKDQEMAKEENPTNVNLDQEVPIEIKARPTIGIITALSKEYAAVKTMLDNGKPYPIKNKVTSRQYYLGEMPTADHGRHTVVLSLMTKMGTNVAAVWAANLLLDFPSVRTIIMVGIAGGVPNPKKADEHVRLGDVVVSSEKGVVQYDFIKEEVFEVTPRHASHQPSATLLETARIIEANELDGQRHWIKNLVRAKSLRNAARPPSTSDVLYKFIRVKGKRLAKRRIPHPRDSERKRSPREPRVFIGPIASSNSLQKDPFKRDALRDIFGVRAIEMEASGIADATWLHGVEYFVVRGICDYCDPSKNDKWQGYAANVAAAYTRGLLALVTSSSTDESSVSPRVAGSTQAEAKMPESLVIARGSRGKSALEPDRRAREPIDLASEREILQRAYNMAFRALAILEEQKAAYTSTTIPPHLQIALEDKLGEVNDLKERLAKLEK